MQKYRADKSESQQDGAVAWFATGWGGPTLAKIESCRLENLAGNMRRTVYITSEADTYFSISAVCKIAGCRIRGYVTNDDEGNIVFRHCYY
jgi:hypothetical protein